MLKTVLGGSDGDLVTDDHGIVVPSTSKNDDDHSENELQSSEMTSPATEEGSTTSGEEGDGMGWFGGISTDFKNIATSIKDTIPPAIGDIASFVQQSALSMAAEIAKLEQEEEYHYNANAEGEGQLRGDSSPLRLPWEIRDQTSNNNVYVEDGNLKEKILALSTNSSTFFDPYSTKNEEGEEEDTDEAFVFDEPRVQLIRRLLEIDDNLASMHAKLSARSDVRETMFWRNYFYHCNQVRGEVLGQQQERSKQAVPKEEEDQQQQEKDLEPTKVMPQQEQTVPKQQVPKTPDRKMFKSKESSSNSPGDDASYVNIATPPASLNSWTELIPTMEDFGFKQQN